MQSVNWQMYVAGEPVQPGVDLRVSEKWQNAAGAYVVLQPAEKEKTTTFLVRYNVNIGGKDYLLIHADTESADELTAIRMLNKSQLSAMDPDRFSSLVNAICRYLEETPPTSTEELARVLGDLPRDPGFSP